jgi:hypothetical protein
MIRIDLGTTNHYFVFTSMSTSENEKAELQKMSVPHIGEGGHGIKSA